MGIEGEYPYGPAVVICDGCDRQLHVEARSEEHAGEAAAAEGWLATDGWRWYCVSCAEERDLTDGDPTPPHGITRPHLHVIDGGRL
jgi:hypothetical protein